MWCPLVEFELAVEACPVQCSYKHVNGDCKHSELAFEEEVSATKISEVRGIPLEIVEREIRRARKDIEVAVTVDGYLLYTGCKTHVSDNKKKVFKLFGINRKSFKDVLNKNGFEAWRQNRKTNITYEDVMKFFSKHLSEDTA